jgi:hypothetical protein
MKVELLWDDSKKQASLIFESVVVTQASIHLAREQPDTCMVSKTSRKAIVHNDDQGDDSGLPHDCARLPHDTSLGYPWVARTLSRYTSM